MGISYRYIADPFDHLCVIEWFRRLASPPKEIELKSDSEHALFFQELGSLIDSENDSGIDAKKTPVVTLFQPTVRRGTLWTVGEVHFLPTPLKTLFPVLHKISQDFSKWLQTHECIFSNKHQSQNEWDYFLEGSVRNSDAPVFAFESGLAALKNGQYFVSHGETEFMLDTICANLSLRGIVCK